MRRCISCHHVKPLVEFPSPLALACNFCTPVSDNLTQTILRGKTPKTLTLTPEPSPPAKADERPLIDQLQEATFIDDPGLSQIGDKYALRMLLRKAHRFMLDKPTSAMIADFSLAIAPDLESARLLAVPPFPVTWFELDNLARLYRLRDLGQKIVGEDKGGPTERVGWLIHPERNGFFATYVTCIDAGLMVAPLSYWWHVGAPFGNRPFQKDDESVQRVTFGMANSGVGPLDAFPSETAMHRPLPTRSIVLNRVVSETMHELAGELRHIWGLLLALGAGQHGVEAATSPHPSRNDPAPIMPNGKPLLPLEHKILHLHLAKRATPERVVLRAVSGHRRRQHEVRAHWRTYRNDDGSVRRRALIKEHKRGDVRLGRITKEYRVER